MKKTQFAVNRMLPAKVMRWMPASIKGNAVNGIAVTVCDTYFHETAAGQYRWNVFKPHLAFVSSSSVATSQETIGWNEAKPFNEIPGPKKQGVIGSLIAVGTLIRNVEHTMTLLGENFKTFGPIVKVEAGNLNMLHLCEVNAVEKVHRSDGRYPRRISVGAWNEWREINKLVKGVLTNNVGPDWKRMRTVMDKRLLRPQHVATYTDSFNEVITDFIKRLKFIRDHKSDGHVVPNIDMELFHWSFETICTVLYETRIGCLSDQRDPYMTKFINAAIKMLETTGTVAYFPRKINRLLFPRAQKLHDDSWATIFATTERLVNERLKKLDETNSESSLLAFLLSNGMPLEEIYANVSELMAAAVDTTSNTMQWVLYELSRHSDIQQRLYDEISSVVPQGSVPGYEDLQKMPYLRAVVKEVLRKYPVAAVSTRITNVDLVLCGYQVPADTTVISNTFWMGRDPDLFPDPESFKPERWLRSDSSVEAINPFSWLPFGYGSRMCIGRRIAELEIYLLLCRILQTFELKPDSKPLMPRSRGVLVPERAVNVTFVDRKK